MLIEKTSSKQSLFSLVIVTYRLCDEKMDSHQRLGKRLDFGMGCWLWPISNLELNSVDLGPIPPHNSTQPKLYLNSFLNGRLLKIDMNIGPLASTKLFVVKNDLFWLTPMLEANKLAFGSSIASNPEQKRRQT